MLQVYDRVPTRGAATLLIMLFALATLALLDWTRSRLLVRTSLRLDGLVAGTLRDATLARNDGTIDAVARQSMRDFDSPRQALTGPMLLSLCDAPWSPVYMLISFIIPRCDGWGWSAVRCYRRSRRATSVIPGAACATARSKPMARATRLSCVSLARPMASWTIARCRRKPRMDERSRHPPVGPVFGYRVGPTDRRPATRITHGGIVAAAFFVLFQGWAALAPLDAEVTVSGQMQVSGQR